ncbi:hypothetical protein D9V32_11610 [Mycetocola tolaasinivorans]|uniref:EamA domain-containing protein n=1 Tax=Mycetocola tolaasinivorans TaxID=76635 RepID=A0A3L7A435_9MICO|nr:EamA family transporter [Mycetocola tolaasinivorans]RLP75059.1 hypothetical protein D9V32_11610 [Mycetocola tolaasinivorans]
METWFLVVLAIIFNGGDRLLTRATLRRSGEPDRFLLVYQATATLITAPAAIFSLVNPPQYAVNTEHPSEFWVLIPLSIALWASYSVFSFRSASLLEVSIASTIGRLRIVITAVLGVVLFGETLGPIGWIGIVLLVLAYLPISRLPSATMNRRGLVYAVAATLAISLALILDKALTAGIPPSVVVFLGFLGTTIVALVLNRNRLREPESWLLWPAVVAGIAGAAGYYLLLSALVDGQASIILPIYQAAGILYVVAGIIILSERDHVAQKLTAAGIAAAGVVLVVGT